MKTTILFFGSLALALGMALAVDCGIKDKCHRRACPDGSAAVFVQHECFCAVKPGP